MTAVSPEQSFYVVWTIASVALVWRYSVANNDFGGCPNGKPTSAFFFRRQLFGGNNLGGGQSLNLSQ